MEALDWLVIGVFFLALIGIIVWVVRQKQNDSADYFLGGRDATWLAIGASIFASNIGSEHLIGLAGAGASSGMAMAHWEIQGWMILILGWVFVPFYSRSMVYTMPEFLERRYNPQSRTILSVISLVSYVLTKVAVTVYAGGLVFQQVFGIKELWGIDFFWIAAIGLVVLTALYTIFGGMKSVLYTSVLQTPILLLGSLIILVLGFKELGGWDEMMRVCGAVTVNDYGDTMTNLIRSNDDANFPWLGALIGSEVGGVMIEGWQNIFLAQLADPNTTHFFGNIALYNSGRYIHMLFTMPAICLAMYHAIPDKKRRKKTLGFLLSLALTCFITGVTEPISFALLFANPILFIAEALIFALGFVACAVTGVTIGSTFSAGLIEFLLFGVFQGNAKTGFVWIIILGIPFAIASYFIYRFLIAKLDAKTPGREDDNEEAESSLKTAYKSGQAKAIIEALGGIKNIEDIDNCATRLRVNIKKIADVNLDSLKETGAHNTLVRGKNLQVIYGPSVNIVRVEIDEYLESLNN